MVRAKVKRADYERAAYLAWNAFVELVSDPVKGMSRLQLDVAEAFLYENEVQNGGHLQYFENHGRERGQNAVQALGRLGLTCHQKVLQEAIETWGSEKRKPVETAEDYSEIALQGEFDHSDGAYHACAPDMQEHLERILATHFDEFIELV